MEIANTCEALVVRNSELTESRFSGAKLTKSTFNDVNLLGSTFVNVNLGGAQFVDVNLAGVSIQDANLTGMTIDGILVSELLRAFRSRVQSVLYARNLARMQAFYEGVFLLKVEHAEPDHVVLAAAAMQLILVQVPEAIAATISIADPPMRRTETPIKLVFEVESLASVRDTALKLGGRLDPLEREWSYEGCRICDGHDPEGNVVQFRQK